MFVCGQITAGSGLQQNKQPNCIRVELYPLIVVYLCVNYVGSMSPLLMVRFKHATLDTVPMKSPERIFGAGYSISYGSHEHELPIRITGVSSSSFRFEVGLIRAPISSLSKDFRIEIKPKGVMDAPYVFTKERLNCESITYLPIGERPFEKYTLSFKNGSDKLREFWPTEINGINPEGTLFERTSGKKLTYDADVEIEKEYYLLKRGYFYKRSSSIRIQEIAQKQFGWETWRLYVISASAFCEEAARFFLDFHCRLTDYPVSLQPVWPLFVEGNYIVKHSQDSMYMLVKGNVATVKTFPSAAVRQLTHNYTQARLYEVHCSSRQQLISAGRTQALQYTYFWKEPLNQVGLSPEILVTDLSGSEILPGKANTLPHSKALLFKSTYDGELIISNKDHVVDKRKIYADKPLELDGLSYGVSVQAVIGLDVVWQIDFQKQQSIIADDEAEVLKHISCVSGASIPAPHSLRNILTAISHYPKICQWIRKCIKQGTINEQSYRRLQDTYRSINIQGDKL